MAILLALVIVPVMLVMRSVNKKKKSRANKANKLRVENFMNFTDSDSWDNIVLGLDESTKKLLWFREGTGGDAPAH
ncbi:MAG: hypothetical protein IPM82_23730 [Saprospiraceae bacterium]|nr:hypothetical protein [Saprospiraceae bacterium]